MNAIKRISLVILILWARMAFGQNTFHALIQDAEKQTPLIGANVIIDSLRVGATSDANGEVFLNGIPTGGYTIQVSYIGYEPTAVRVAFSQVKSDRLQIISLKPIALNAREVVVTTTRTNGVIEDTPIRVEVLGREEVNEETAIRPGNISKLLGETSGIQVQQTSITSGNVSFRIQGLPGRYTQLLKDGFPLYGGFAAGLSLLQIPPLDLQQVEVIKGANSTLYGSGAIAGIANLVSRAPTGTPELTAIVSQTQKKGLDMSAFYAQRGDLLGLSLLFNRSQQAAFDVNRDGFTDLPKHLSVTFNPKIFYYPDHRTRVMFGFSLTLADRSGGFMDALANHPDSSRTYYEKSQSQRLTTQFKFTRDYENGGRLVAKNAINHFLRTIDWPTGRFAGAQTASYSEVYYLAHLKQHQPVVGITVVTDQFKVGRNGNVNRDSLNCRHATPGMFVQDDWQVTPRILVQPGLRIDWQNHYGTFVLPRLSLLYKGTNRLHFRLGYGTGYSVPDIFNSDATEQQYSRITALPAGLKAESAQGLNLDVGYRFIVGELVLNANLAFYLSRIDHALVATRVNEHILYSNAPAELTARGFDLNLKMALDELELYADYTTTRVRKAYDPVQPYLALTPQQKLNLTFTYELEGSWRTGLEAFYTGRQYLENQTLTRDYWTMGFMLEKMFQHVSIIGNVENLLDVRQTRYETMVNPPYDTPDFQPVYMPLDGIVANLAVKYQL